MGGTGRDDEGIDVAELPASIEVDLNVDSEQFQDAIREAIQAARKAALLEAAAAYEAYGADVYWRDDSAFHSDGRFWTKSGADWLRERAEGPVE